MQARLRLEQWDVSIVQRLSTEATHWIRFGSKTISEKILEHIDDAVIGKEDTRDLLQGLRKTLFKEPDMDPSRVGKKEMSVEEGIHV
jgi:hypothetical protein